MLVSPLARPRVDVHYLPNSEPSAAQGCCTCNDLCTEHITVHRGFVDGKPGEIDKSQAITVIEQPLQCCRANGCTPTLHVSSPEPKRGRASTPYAQVTGPVCFGGCSELCIDSYFTYSTFQGQKIADIKHLRPRGCVEILKACCTDSADNYALTFENTADGMQRAHALASAFVVYMFFEIDSGMCSIRDDTIIITCFLCSFYGCLCPCNCYIPLSRLSRVAIRAILGGNDP